MRTRTSFLPFRLMIGRFRRQTFLDRLRGRAIWGLLCFAGALLQAAAADFTVTYPGSSAYAFNGSGRNPTVTVVRGELYTFFINNTSPSHPFRILNSTGVTNNNIYNGTITWRVPTNAVNYRYDCSVHGFGGQILTVPPPTFRIVNLSVGPSLVLKSTGTNWNLTPQYSTNLGRTNWFALTVQSNRYINGTNETFCGRPPVSNAFIRVRAQRN